MIVLNPRAEEQEAMELALVEKQARIALEKKEKKKAKANKKDLESMNGADSKLLDLTSSSSKRKLDEATTTDSHKHKKQHTTTTTTTATLSSTHSLTAAVAAKVAEQMAINASRQKSSAIQSLYNNGRISKENFMNR